MNESCVYNNSLLPFRQGFGWVRHCRYKLLETATRVKNSPVNTLDDVWGTACLQRVHINGSWNLHLSDLRRSVNKRDGWYLRTKIITKRGALQGANTNEARPFVKQVHAHTRSASLFPASRAGINRTRNQPTHIKKSALIKPLDRSASEFCLASMGSNGAQLLTSEIGSWRGVVNRINKIHKRADQIKHSTSP